MCYVVTDGSPFYMPQLRKALPASRTNLDPPDSSLKRSAPGRNSNVLPPVVTSSVAGMVPDSTSSGLISLPDGASSQSSLRQAVTNSGVSPGVTSSVGSSLGQALANSASPTARPAGGATGEFEELDMTIESFSQDVEDWKKMGLLDDDQDMVEAQENKKRDRSYANEVGISSRRDEGRLLAPFPMVPDPLEFVQQHLGLAELNAITAQPEERRQFWLVDYLKDILLTFPEEHQETILKAPKEERFFVMKKLFDELGLGAKNSSGHQDAGSG